MNNFLNKIFLIFRNYQNKKLFLAWIAGIGSIFVISMYYGESNIFLGITEMKELVINYDLPATLKKLYVSQGQSVSKGMLLLELERPDLEIRINKIASDIEQFSAMYSRNSNLILNSDTENYDKARNSNNLKSQDPNVIQIIGLKKEYQLLKEEEKKLAIRSEINGTVCAVNYKIGEKLAPFNPIITLCPEAPTLVIGYIHENLYSSIKKGQKVTAQSLSGNFYSTEGEITALGSRIIPIPEHIKKISGIPLWGREVLINIPHNNYFLFGEKVTIKVQSPVLNNLHESNLNNAKY